MTEASLTPDELLDAWPLLSAEERTDGFTLLSRAEAEALFYRLDTNQQADLLLALSPGERRLWMRALAPDDAADLIQVIPEEQRAAFLELLDESTRSDVTALLAYEEDQAGGLMSPRFARLRPDMSVDEAITYLRRQTREGVENIYYGYVLDARQCLLGVVSLRQLVAAPGGQLVRNVMVRDVISIPEEMDQEAVSRIFAEHSLIALPVVDAENRMKGIVTVDDIVEVVEEEATEDIQKMGGTEALDVGYLDTRLAGMLRKRAPWLVVLFVGQTATASVMGIFEEQMAQMLTLSLFVPLILSSGGNAGSQAATLVVRALSLGEVRLREWWQVMRLEVMVGFSMGLLLAVFGLVRILAWHHLFGEYGKDYVRMGVAVSASILGVVAWGTLVGAMLPLLLRRLGLDPASASTPFVATLCDVTGLVIYFTIAGAIVLV